MTEKKLTRKESIVKEKQKDKLRGVTTKSGSRGLSKRERPVQTNKKVKREMQHQDYLDRISKRGGGMAQKGLGRAFKKGGKA
jgi:hypothetical protein